MSRNEILMIQKVLLLHSNNFKGVWAVGSFDHRKPITRNVHGGTCLPLFDLGEVRVVPEEGIPLREELMIKYFVDLAKMNFVVQANNGQVFVLATATIRIRNQKT